MKNKISIANILLTRLCNLRCSYCNIVQNYKNKPIEYPDINHYVKNNLNPYEWLEILSRLRNNNPDIFFILYGGEPFLYPGIEIIIKELNDWDANYTIITNNTDDIQENIQKTLEYVEYFKGFTSSIDPYLVYPQEKLFELYNETTAKDIIHKSQKGFEKLKYYKKENKAKDVVAEITIIGQTGADYLIPLIELLTSEGIWASITVVDFKKTDYYDFSGVSNNETSIHNFGVHKHENIRNKFDEIIKRSNAGELLVHLPELLNTLYDSLPSNYDCKLNEDLHNVTVDADGSFRLCLRVRGVDAPSFDYKHVIDEHGTISTNFLNAYDNDYKKYCKLCNWTCPIISSYSTDRIVSH